MENFSPSEERRLASLQALKLLDTGTHPSFDRVTRHCIQIFECSIAMISLADKDRLWVLSSVGLDFNEIPRDSTFTNQTLAGGRTLIVARASSDERFVNNPLVKAGPRLQSFIGCPIRSPDGVLVGALCLGDPRPDLFSSNQAPILEGLAAVAEDLFELHSKNLQTAELNKVLALQTEKLQTSDRLFRQAERIAKIGFWELELESNSLTWSDQVYAIHEVPLHEPVDVPKAVRFYDSNDRPLVQQAVNNAIHNHESFEFEANLLSAAGHARRVKSVGEYMPGDASRSSRLIGVFHDITDTYRDHASLLRAAEYDSLTNLYNRYAFDRALKERLKQAREGDQPLCLLLIDLDGFKDVNDVFGHLVGDVLLEEISAQISRAVPNGTTVARWGGDEFAIITQPGITLAEATRIGEQILAEISSQSEISGRTFNIGATCGLAQANKKSTAKELVHKVDLALYHGKTHEPGQVHVYHSSFEQSNDLRHKAIVEVRSALNEGRLFAGYQPVVELANYRLVGLEALMRLHTRSGKMLTATQVLPAIIDPVLSREIGERMLSFVCTDLPELQLAHPNLAFLSINATEADLISRDFAQKFLKVLEGNLVDPRNVTLEVTETMLMVNDSSTVRNVLMTLHRAGIQIALDDFGTGFSSLSHLRDFPIDKVKIDRSFVAKICTNHQDRLIVQALIAMGNNLNIEVIAEGVETEEQRSLLMQMGCTYGQGYLFGAADTACRTKLLKFGNAAAIDRSNRAA